MKIKRLYLGYHQVTIGEHEFRIERHCREGVQWELWAVDSDGDVLDYGDPITTMAYKHELVADIKNNPKGYIEKWKAANHATWRFKKWLKKL